MIRQISTYWNDKSLVNLNKEIFKELDEKDLFLDLILGSPISYPQVKIVRLINQQPVLDVLYRKNTVYVDCDDVLVMKNNDKVNLEVKFIAKTKCNHGYLHDKVTTLLSGEKKYFNLKEKDKFVDEYNLINFELSNDNATGCLLKGGIKWE